MKIGIVIIAIIALALVIAYISGAFAMTGQTQENNEVAKKLTTSSPTNTAPNNEPANETPPILTTASSSTPAGPPGGTSPGGGKVEFGFTLDDISGSGLSRNVTARLSNLGPDDAHNVWGKLEGFSRETRVKLSGRENIRIDVGTLSSGATVTRQLTLSFSLSDGLKILQNGAKFVLTVYSDEQTQAIPYDYKP